MEWYWVAFILLFLLLLFMFAGVPVAFSMGLASVAAILLFLGPRNLIHIANIAYERGSEFLFIVAPLFILMAALVAYSGVAESMYTAAYRWFNRLPGALASSSILACTGFAAVSGSSPATAATVGLFAIPEMVKRGYSKRLACGAVCAGGTLGILIPPAFP